MFSVEICVSYMKKICQETGKKIRERISVQKSAKMPSSRHFQRQRPTVVRAFLNFKGHQTVLNSLRIGKGLGTREHLFVFVKINYGPITRNRFSIAE